MEEVGPLEHSILLSELEWLEKDINKTVEAVRAVLGRWTLIHHQVQDGLDLISSFTQKLKGVESLIPGVRGVLSMTIIPSNNEEGVGGEDEDMINDQAGLSISSSYHHEGEGEVEGTQELQGSRERGVNCPVCHKQLAHRWSLENHVKRVHQGPRPHQCEICNKTFAHPQELTQHISRHEEIQNFPFTTRKIRVDPVVFGGGSSCLKCDKWFPYKGQLRRHLESTDHNDSPPTLPAVGHKPKKHFSCDICTNTGFRDKRAYRVHRQNVHQEQWFQCLKCNRKWFQDEGTLRKHEELNHNPNRLKYQCRICFKTSSRLDYLNRHILTHKKRDENINIDDPDSKDKSSESEGSKFQNIFYNADVSSLNETPTTTTNTLVKFKGPLAIPERVKCLKCGKQYAHRWNLERHERKVHRYAQKRPQRCGHCTKTFAQEHLLIAHMRSHVPLKKRSSKSLIIHRNRIRSIKNKHPPRPRLRSLSNSDYPVNRSERRGRPMQLGWKLHRKFKDVGRAKGYLKEMFYRQVASNSTSEGKKIYYYCMKGNCPKKALLHVPGTDNTTEVTMFLTGNEHNHQNEELNEENDDPTSPIIDQLPHERGEECNEDQASNSINEGDPEDAADGYVNSFFAMSRATATSSDLEEDDEDVEDIALLEM